MNINSNKIFGSVFMLVVICLASCSSDDKDSDESIFQKKLNGTWTLNNGGVMLDGLDVTGAFGDMKITFKNNKTYAVEHTVSPIWPTQGSFTLVKSSNGLFNLHRSDDVLITVTELSDHAITFHLNYDSPTGRTNSVSGEYTFEMTK